MSNKNKMGAQKPSIDPMFIDEAGLVRYGIVMPLIEPESNQHRTIRTREPFGGGVIPASLRTPADDLQITTVTSLLIDWLLETYGAQYNIKSRSEEAGPPGVL